MPRPILLLALLLTLSASTKAEDSKLAEPKREKVVGGIAFPPEKRTWTRITGQVTVLSASRLAFADGTEVNLQWGMNAPDLAQQGRLGERLYPAGKEAADFLRELIGDRAVTFIGVFCRGNKLGNRNDSGGGWAVSDHEGMDPFEIMARENKRGLWRGEFIPPQRWRKGERLPGEPAAAPKPKVEGVLKELRSGRPRTRGRSPDLLHGQVERQVAEQQPGKDPAAKDAAPAEKPAVIRDEVPGSINHSKGSTWNRIIGKVKVLDANNIEFADGTRIDLDISVPAPGQMAMNGEGLYPCGQAAGEFLRKFIGDKSVICFKNDDDGPSMAYVGNDNLERVMIVNGWGLADHSSLHADEIIARENKRGLWQGKFIHPDTWRAGVRLPGEMPPPKISNEAAARKLFWVYGEDEDALPSIISRVVSEFPTLRKIHFTQRGRLTDDGLAQLAKLDQLEVLDIAGCGDVTNAGLAHLQAFPNLRELHLPHTISDSGLVHLEKLTELEKLTTDHWRGDPITDAGLAHLKRLRRLKHLVLNGLETSDAGLANLKELPDLAVLEFGRMPVGDAGLVHIGQLRNLEYLDISGTEVTDAGLPRLAGLKRLRVLKPPDRVSERARKELQRALLELKFEGDLPK